MLGSKEFKLCCIFIMTEKKTCLWWSRTFSVLGFLKSCDTDLSNPDVNRVPAAGLKLPKQPRPAQSEVGQTCEVISTPVKLRSEGKQRLGPLENVCVHPCLRACMPAVFWIESMHAYRMHN